MTLFRIAVIGTKRPNRLYVTEFNNDIHLSDIFADALHWNKRTAIILTSAINTEFARLGRPERFQIEKNT